MDELHWAEIKTEHYNELIARHREIINTIAEYNTRIVQGDYLEYNKTLNIGLYYDLITAHAINLLVSDDTLYIPFALMAIFKEHHSAALGFVDWTFLNDGYSFKLKNETEKVNLQARLFNQCFNENGRQFIKEICSQDIIYSNILAKKIESFMDSITTTIVYEAKSEDEVYSYYSAVRKTSIRNRFEMEYEHNGALAKCREFKHHYTGMHIADKVVLSSESEYALNYRVDKNLCQSAIMHIGIADTGSSGTGFKISKDYALTCAHVVEGAKEIFANVIVNDGYSSSRLEGPEVYDVGYGEVIFQNSQLDIALIKTEYCGLTYLSVETRNILPELGEEVVVFGYPLGFDMPQTNRFGPNISFYKGYVSSNQVKDGNSITFLDIDVKSGNSGSPVISVKTGKVIGIISGAKVSGQAVLVEKMPYMIPIQHFLELLK